MNTPLDRFFNIDEFLGKAIETILTRGPKIFLILFLAWMSLRLIRLLTGRINSAMRTKWATDAAQREQRAKTLSSLIGSACKAAIFITTAMTVLPELGINVAPIIAGAGVLGLAVGFGAQNLVKDVVTGFFLILENQYCVGESVRIGAVEGVVEEISLRLTIVRDSSGVLHYIPNGQVATVGNHTRDWSLATVEIWAAYGEDPEKVISVISAACAEIVADDAFAPLIAAPPASVSLDSFSREKSVYKISIKTLPQKHSAVASAIRKKVRAAFEQHGIAPGGSCI